MGHHLDLEAVDDVRLVILRVGCAYRTLQRPHQLVRAHLGRFLAKVGPHQIHQVLNEVPLAEEEVPLHGEALLPEVELIEQDLHEPPVDPSARLAHHRLKRPGLPVLQRRGGRRVCYARHLLIPPAVAAARAQEVDALARPQDLLSKVQGNEGKQHRLLQAVAAPPEVALGHGGVRGHKELLVGVLELALVEPPPDHYEDRGAHLAEDPRHEAASEGVPVESVRVDGGRQRATPHELCRVHKHRHEPRVFDLGFRV
mmetsp:Transcript_36221/g.114262  ORF Transcript_36221/g.114262 Transcript_36221/m.114262 type:complete len:256 (+) Transcript_36221:865-1632(+)